MLTSPESLFPTIKTRVVPQFNIRYILIASAKMHKKNELELREKIRLLTQQTSVC
jgi:hypothetical protein